MGLAVVEAASQASLQLQLKSELLAYTRAFNDVNGGTPLPLLVLCGRCLVKDKITRPVGHLEPKT